jgi:L-fuculose-phosphate aldolase
MNERTLRAEVSEAATQLHARGWVANHDGNVTARAGRDRFLATPTAVSKRRIEPGGLLVVDARGERITGSGKPFSEIGLHLTVYGNRPDATCVVHAHPPCATGLACAGSRLLERPFLPEAVVSLGPSIPTVPYAPPGRAACEALAPFVGGYDAVLLANHGVLAWGADVEQAFLRLELVEHLARIALEAERAGGLRPLPEASVAPLLEARQKAGLARPSTGAAGQVVVACAPAPAGSDVQVIAPGRSSPRPAAGSDLATIIREELVKALKQP